MDRAAFIATLTTEISGNPVSVALQNHLYGCISLLELLAEGHLSEVSADFSAVGAEYGFYDGSGANYAGSEPYRAAWEWAWKEMGEGHDLEAVDAFEDEFLRTALRIFGEGSFFAKALAAGELSEEEVAAVAAALATPVAQPAAPATAAPANDSTVPVPTNKIPHRRKTRRHRAITPLRSKRVTALTRRKRRALSS
jgi:hypothetical protein